MENISLWQYVVIGGPAAVVGGAIMWLLDKEYILGLENALLSEPDRTPEIIMPHAPRRQVLGGVPDFHLHVQVRDPGDLPRPGLRGYAGRHVPGADQLQGRCRQESARRYVPARHGHCPSGRRRYLVPEATMTDLQKLHAFCTKLGHYPSRWAIQQEIERLLTEEKARYAQGGMVQGVVHVLEGEPPFGPYPSVVIEPTVDERLRQTAEWCEEQAAALNVAFYSERACYLEAAKKARSMIDEGPEIDVNIDVLASTFKRLTAKQEARP